MTMSARNAKEEERRESMATVLSEKSLMRILHERERVRKQLKSTLGSIFDGEGARGGDREERAKNVHPVMPEETSGGRGRGRGTTAQDIPRFMRKAYSDVERRGKGREEPRARETWQGMRKDWKPFDPSKSLAEQQNLSGNQVISSMMKAPSASGSTPSANAASDGCSSDWFAHPLDCIRKAYHGRMKGTKFERVGSAPSSSTSAEGLTQEREKVAREVAQGMLSGTIRVPEHSKLAASIQRAREALDEKLAAEAKDVKPPEVASVTTRRKEAHGKKASSSPRNHGGSRETADPLQDAAVATPTSSRAPPRRKLSAGQLLSIVRSRERRRRMVSMFKEKKDIEDAEQAYKEGELAAQAYQKGQLDAREYEAGLQAGRKYGKLASGNDNSYVVLPLKPSEAATAKFIPSLLTLAVAEQRRMQEKKQWDEEKKLATLHQLASAAREKRMALEEETGQALLKDNTFTPQGSLQLVAKNAERIAFATAASKLYRQKLSEKRPRKAP
ncbi:hypothetical protein GUITHDRAFT_108374 [Guillardia theta CCMP2712]|uniref:Uncharacterized protein n=1 Tax=Guillardia theta (strain CCMP2712) TaxID=905079 RepID=L1JBL2_GUITC|nr:hypothetical protein GUITHDRAFT_108374 [Guillardia theta CCMP2712]EKX45923.1 hypothetical protein GUITHDRAFT_108374 [Guillardia theta CCMP2712]|eukprot:XP_005832903.1 hypothetical protein GUITHDRAFT_108374 [Guillardia theta CCMP2712]